MDKTVIGIFSSIDQTYRSLREIESTKLVNDISIVSKNTINKNNTSEEFAKEISDWETGLLSSFKGLLVQTEPFEVKGLGEVVAAGPLAGALMQKDKGISDCLVYYGVGTETAEKYEDMVGENGILTVIKSDGSKVNQIANILKGYGADYVEIWSKGADKPFIPKNS